MMARVRRSFVGIDVSKQSLSVSWRGIKEQRHDFEVSNDELGFAELCKRVTAGRIQQARVVLEATGPYHAKLTRFLQQSKNVEVMVVPPVAAAAFAKASMQRAKTDRVDGRMLLRFCETMPFEATASRSEEADAVRCLGRHLRFLIDVRTAFKNQRHTSEAYGISAVEPHEEAGLSSLDTQIAAVERDLQSRLSRNAAWKRTFDRLVGERGIAERSAGLLLSEFVMMPKDLTAKQVTAHVGLDPRPRLSGTSRTRSSHRISKKGNARLRRTLYMLALTTSTFHPAMRAHYQRLVERGKPKSVALVALMRKLLVSAWMMYTRDEGFDSKKFTSAG